jgi:hypothetical protein
MTGGEGKREALQIVSYESMEMCSTDLFRLDRFCYDSSPGARSAHPR